MNIFFKYLPNVTSEEILFLQSIIGNWEEEKIQQFCMIYSQRRRDPMLILGTTLIGFLWIGGVQRFILNQIGMGILYLFTCGLCFIGTIVDLVNHKDLTFEYNQKQAREILMFLK